jgi:CMP-N-acetylneuraminic acid synthetase
MKVVALVPIKLKSERIPHKSIKQLGGRPLCYYLLNTLKSINSIDEVFVYCSDKAIKNYLPSGVIFKQRNKNLDGSKVKSLQIISAFVKEVDADIYILSHVTSPFIKKNSIESAIKQVKNNRYDSAFSAERIQTFV